MDGRDLGHPFFNDLFGKQIYFASFILRLRLNFGIAA